MRFINKNIKIILIVFLALSLKAILLLGERIPFNSDEAIVALMARHILEGERPVFFYGQVYMGSLDAFLVAGGFLLFGQHVWVIRLLQGVLYLCTIITTAAIGRLAFRSAEAGLMAALLLAIPTVNVSLYTTASLGGYGEALLLGNLIFLLGFWLLQNDEISSFSTKTLVFIFLLGLCSGLGLWANGITLVFSVPVILAIGARQVIHFRRTRQWSALACLLLVIIGGLVGAFPWWLYAMQKGWPALIYELLGSAVAVEKGAWLTRIADHLVNLVLLGGTATFGLRPPWEIRWLALPLIPFVMGFWLAVIVFWVKKFLSSSNNRLGYRLLAGIPLMVVAGFLFTPFGVDPSGRYFLPVTMPLALVAVLMVKEWIPSNGLRKIAVVGLLIFNLTGTLQCAWKSTPGLTTQFYAVTIIDHRYDQELINFLKEHHETRGYTNYWVSYPIAFLSQEEVIFTPRLPYHLDLRHTSRDNRYKPYHDLVESSERVSYITTRNPVLDDLLRKKFKDNKITWQEKVIGDYRIYYDISYPIRPEEIGL